MTIIDWLIALYGVAVVSQWHLTGTDELARLESASPPAVAAGELAWVSVGGAAFPLSASGELDAHERAAEARNRLWRAARHFDWPRGFKRTGLALWPASGAVHLRYGDLTLFTVTEADAARAGAESPARLARAMSERLARAVAALPAPIPDGAIAVAGRPAGRALVSDRTLEETFAMAVGPEARRVRIRAQDGRLLLSGSVETGLARERLLRLAAAFPGCTGVVDGLEVGP